MGRHVQELKEHICITHNKVLLVKLDVFSCGQTHVGDEWTCSTRTGGFMLIKLGVFAWKNTFWDST